MIPVVSVSIVLRLMTGFAFAFLSFPFKRLAFVLLTVGMMVATAAFIIPLYHEMRSLGLLNSHAAMILPQTAMSVPLATIFMATTMRQLPPDIREAAMLDGAPRGMILRRVILPLLKPAISSLGLFRFIWTGNEVLIPLILVNDDVYRTMPLGMVFFQGRYTVNTPVLTADASK